MSTRGLGRRDVVRGTARRVVIVPQPEDGSFEQAIFIVRGECSVSESDLLLEAMECANAQPDEPTLGLKRQKPSLKWRLRRAAPWLIGAAGAAGAVVAAVAIF